MPHSDPDFQEYQQYLADHQEYATYLKETGQDKPPPNPSAPPINSFNTAAKVEEKSSFRKMADMATAAVGGIASTVGTPRYPGMTDAMSEHPDATSVGHGAGTLVEAYAAPKVASMIGRAGLGSILRGTSGAYKAVKNAGKGGFSGVLDRAANFIDPVTKATKAVVEEAPAAEAPASISLADILAGLQAKGKIDPFTKVKAAAEAVAPNVGKYDPFTKRLIK